MSESETHHSIESLVKLQLNRLSSIEKIFSNFKKDPVSRKTQTYFSQRFKRIKELKTEFLATHTMIVCTDIKGEQEYLKNDIATQFEELHLDIFCALTQRHDEMYPPSLHVENPSSQPSEPQKGCGSSIHFPQLPVPSFSGKFTEWPSFHDSFDRLIHQNLELNSIQKFHFLKKALPIDRDMDLQQMPLTDANYSTAWELLLKRYNNPRVLFSHHMNSLYSLPTLVKERSDEIKAMLNIANVCINEFKRLTLPIGQCNHWIAHYLSTKLPTDTHQAWERHLGSKTNVPSFSDLECFLTTRLFTIDAIENRNIAHSTVTTSKPYKGSSKPDQYSNSSKPSSRSVPNSKSFHMTTKPKPSYRESCGICSQPHIIRHCPTFLLQDCFERKAIVDKMKLCLNCLSKSHAFSKCTSNKNCFQCGQRHHTLLHFPTTDSNKTSFAGTAHHPVNQLRAPVDSPSAATHERMIAPSAHFDEASASAAPFVPQRSNSTLAKIPTYTTQCYENNSLSTSGKQILLATALIQLSNDETGQSCLVYALIDQGSEATIISENAVQRLGLKRKPTSANICGVSSNTQSESRSVVSCILRSCYDETFAVQIENAYVLKQLSILLPSQRIQPENWSHIQGLELADPKYYYPKKIDLIIGADMFAQILLPESRIGKIDQPIAQKTYLGWILSGQTKSTTSSVTFRCHHSTIELEALVRKFYESEQVPTEKTMSAQNQWCEEFFCKTHIRQVNGKYFVRLPLKSIYDSNQTLGKSKNIALNRFYQLERRLHQNLELREQYVDAIEDYFRLKQIVPAITSEEDHFTMTASNKPTTTSCVLPHHAVVKEESLTTKVRIVYDASSKTSNGRSLNDILCIGPRLQNELPSVILNWRMHKVVFLADIQKMYRCIDIHPEDAQYQRIWWRSPDGKLEQYCLTTVTFGTASAPYTAIRVLHKIAEDEKSRFPLSEDVLKYEIYVDDVQSGSYSIEHALLKRDHLIGALKSAGMQLRKWSSNSTELLRSIPAEHRSCKSMLQLNENEAVKTLGLYWRPNLDIFTFNLNFKIDLKATKRPVLSTIARLFDPLGYITPITIAAKIILKQIWNSKVLGKDNELTTLDWDSELPPALYKSWQQFLIQLPHINGIEIPRWLDYSAGKSESIELHVFSDGSSSAYAAAVYIRIQYNETSIYTHLLVAKSKVTPTKPLTIPRVELSGAVLATELAEWVRKNLRELSSDTPIYYWTDATIILHWIYGDINRWTMYVANRISKIQQVSNPAQWRYVSTTENPADCATRGLVPGTLQHFQLWWTGPRWLQQPKYEWPNFHMNGLDTEGVSAEEKPKRVLVNFTISQESILFRYSSLNKLLRINALIMRFCHNIRPKNRHLRYLGTITTTELKQSLFNLVKLVQQVEFGKEMVLIKSKKSLPTKSKLISLAPFLDPNVILRVWGRLQRSILPYRQKHPIILPSHHYFTTLVIDNAHHNTLHGGVQLTLANIRQQFWILSSRKTVRTRLRQCVTCFRNKPEVSKQLMGDLPTQRINPPNRPFLATGVDYTGAIDLKSSKYRGNTFYKGYIAIFICLATKAVHLEAVTGMSTEHFLWALQRLIGRRGMCHDIYSDCGTNFIGAEAVLNINQRKFIDDVQREIVPRLAEQSIQWHFNPPYSPNFGGLWEANVKSIKHHLKRTIGGNRLTFEELSTVLVRIEACLNSRPLCPLTSDPDDLFVLTPGHFLIGDSLLSPPEAAPENKNISQHYFDLQKLIRNFWAKWSSDWLSHLQARPKWRSEEYNLQLNDIVLIKDDRLPPNYWILGRITELHPGSDQLVRVVTVRTKDGLFKRSISKICRLPIPTYTEGNNSNMSSTQ